MGQLEIFGVFFMSFYLFCFLFGNNWLFDVSVQVDLGFNMNILDIGGGFTGSEFQLKQVSKQLWYDLGCFD